MRHSKFAVAPAVFACCLAASLPIACGDSLEANDDAIALAQDLRRGPAISGVTSASAATSRVGRLNFSSARFDVRFEERVPVSGARHLAACPGRDKPCAKATVMTWSSALMPGRVQRVISSSRRI